MTKKELIKKRIECINETLGTKFIADNDGVYGWSIYEVGENGELRKHDLGFDGAKTTNEMIGFTDGIFAMMRYLRYNDTSNVKW